MANTVHIAAAPMGSVSTHRVIRAIESITSAFNAWMDARRTANELRALSPHELADIGILPGEIDLIARNLASRATRF